jgi:hypothetical protein
MFNLLALLTTAKIVHMVTTKPKHKSEVLMSRRERVYRIYLQMVAENNPVKSKQAEYILRVIDNRLANIQIKNIHTFN